MKFNMNWKPVIPAGLSTMVICLMFSAQVWAVGQNTIHFRNCTSKIIELSSYNSWDPDMTIVYQGGSGTAIISQRSGILAVNGGLGETGSVKCNDEYFWTSYPGCNVKTSCVNTTPCSTVTREYDHGNWVWYAPNDVQQGDTCLKFE